MNGLAEFVHILQQYIIIIMAYSYSSRVAEGRVHLFVFVSAKKQSNLNTVNTDNTMNNKLDNCPIVVDTDSVRYHNNNLSGLFTTTLLSSVIWLKEYLNWIQMNPRKGLKFEWSFEVQRIIAYSNTICTLIRHSENTSAGYVEWM